MNISQDIPLPSRESKYPFSEMEVGDSFSVPNTELKKIRSSAYRRNEYSDMVFSVRKTPEGYRCWRTA